MRRLCVLWTMLCVVLLALPVQAKPTLLSAKNTTQCREQETGYTPVQQRYERGLIFRLSRCGYPGSYVMGTLHSDSPRLAPVYEDALAIITGLKTVGFEFVEDERTALVAQQYMMLPPTYDRSLSDMIPPQDYKKLADALESRMKLPREAINRMRPWAAAVSLQYPPPTADGISLDVRLQQRAAAMQKRLVGLETPAEQFRIFDAVPFEKQLGMLRDAIADIPGIDEQNEAFMRAYVARDLKTLHRLSDESLAKTSDAELRAYIEQNLIVNRNRLMVERMQPHLRAGDALIAVGALHLMGNDGILPLLEKQGWRVEVVR